MSGKLERIDNLTRQAYQVLVNLLLPLFPANHFLSGSLLQAMLALLCLFFRHLGWHKTDTLCLEEIVACIEVVNFRYKRLTALPQRLLLLLYALLSP